MKFYIKESGVSQDFKSLTVIAKGFFIKPSQHNKKLQKTKEQFFFPFVSHQSESYHILRTERVNHRF